MSKIRQPFDQYSGHFENRTQENLLTNNDQNIRLLSTVFWTKPKDRNLHWDDFSFVE